MSHMTWLHNVFPTSMFDPQVHWCTFVGQWLNQVRWRGIMQISPQMHHGGSSWRDKFQACAAPILAPFFCSVVTWTIKQHVSPSYCICAHTRTHTPTLSFWVRPLPLGGQCLCWGVSMCTAGKPLKAGLFALLGELLGGQEPISCSECQRLCFQHFSCPPFATGPLFSQCPYRTHLTKPVVADKRERMKKRPMWVIKHCVKCSDKELTELLCYVEPRKKKRGCADSFPVFKGDNHC